MLSIECFALHHAPEGVHKGDKKYLFSNLDHFKEMIVDQL